MGWSHFTWPPQIYNYKTVDQIMIKIFIIVNSLLLRLKHIKLLYLVEHEHDFTQMSR